MDHPQPGGPTASPRHVGVQHRREVLGLAPLGDGVLELRRAEGVQVKLLELGGLEKRAGKKG